MGNTKLMLFYRGEKIDIGADAYFLEALSADIETLKLYADTHPFFSINIIDCFLSDFSLRSTIELRMKRYEFIQLLTAEKIQHGSEKSYNNPFSMKKNRKYILCPRNFLLLTITLLKNWTGETVEGATFASGAWRDHLKTYTYPNNKSEHYSVNEKRRERVKQRLYHLF